MLISYASCPCCGKTNTSYALSAVDHTVSQENFEIWQCADCTLRFTQNVPDKEDIGRYYKSEDYISHTDTKKGFINNMYHRVRRITLASKKNLIKRSTALHSGHVLDIGAGTGAFLHHMQQAGWVVQGLEPDDMARQKAKELHGLELRPSASLFELPGESFDAISMWHVLEHVHDLHDYVTQLKRLIRQNGRIFIAVPNYTSYDAGYYKHHWAAYDVPRHLYHFSPASITQLLLHHGLQLKAIKPMWFDSFYVSMLSEKYKRGKQDLVAAVWNGTISNWKAIWNRERCSSLIYVVGK